MLRAESRGDVDTAHRAQRIQRMLELGGHRGRMRQQRDPASFQLALQLDVGEQAIDAELDHASNLEIEDEAIGMVEIGFPGGMSEGPV